MNPAKISESPSTAAKEETRANQGGNNNSGNPNNKYRK